MLYQLLADKAAQLPKHIAIETADDRVSYECLLKRINNFATTLASSGAGQGDPVVIILPNGIEFIVATFAIAQLGAIIVPVNVAIESTELTFYLTDSQPSVLICQDEMAYRHADLIREHTSNCAVITCLSDASNEANHANTQCQILPSTTALYQYSSGSTGKPKRVVRTQANLLHEAKNYGTSVSLTTKDRILCVIPMFHAYGFGNCLLATIYSGATLFIVSSFNRDTVMTALMAQGITVFPGVPFMFSMLADSRSIEKTKLTGLRLAFSAGAPLPKKVFEGFKNKFGVTLRQLYGSTETGSISVNLEIADHDMCASVGHPIHGTEVTVVDEHGRSLHSGESGEIVVSSLATTSGYANLETVNQETFRDGAFWTGDIGKLDDNGNLFIMGRKKLFINVGANKVDPVEVETVLSSHPSIKESVVLGVKTPHGDEVVKAVLVLNEALESGAAKEWLRGKIASYKIPRMIEVRDEIPRSPLGKILRKHLQD